MRSLDERLRMGEQLEDLYAKTAEIEAAEKKLREMEASIYESTWKVIEEFDVRDDDGGKMIRKQGGGRSYLLRLIEDSLSSGEPK